MNNKFRHPSRPTTIAPPRRCTLDAPGLSPLKTRERGLNLSQQVRQVPLNGYPNDLKINLEVPV
jgi:hypothetical protein